jgi:hypothetical protein
MLPLAAAMLLVSPGCGGTEVNPTGPESTATVTHKDRQVGEEADAGPDVIEPIPTGLTPIPLAQFNSFAGFRRGQSNEGIAKLMPWNSDLGERKTIDIWGNEGWEYDGHLTISWQVPGGQLDYVSVRSEKALAYLESHGHSDARLRTLWDNTMAEARARLGEPTQQADRPHARTFRYDFTAGGAQGTLSLEFNKLLDPPKCEGVSVHWRY